MIWSNDTCTDALDAPLALPAAERPTATSASKSVFSLVAVETVAAAVPAVARCLFPCSCSAGRFASRSAASGGLLLLVWLMGSPTRPLGAARALPLAGSSASSGCLLPPAACWDDSARCCCWCCVAPRGAVPRAPSPPPARGGAPSRPADCGSACMGGTVLSGLSGTSCNYAWPT